MQPGASLSFETHTTVIPANHVPYPDTGAGIQCAALLLNPSPQDSPRRHSGARRNPERSAIANLDSVRPSHGGRECRAYIRPLRPFRPPPPIPALSTQSSLRRHSGGRRNPECSAITNLDSVRPFRSGGGSGRTLAQYTHSGARRNPERYAAANLDSVRPFGRAGERGAYLRALHPTHSSPTIPVDHAPSTQSSPLHPFRRKPESRALRHYRRRFREAVPRWRTPRGIIRGI